MKPTFEDLSTFDWIYSKQSPIQKVQHKAVAEIDRINHTSNKINGIVTHLIIKRYA